MPQAGFESMITASEGGKTVHALDLSATVTGQILLPTYFFMFIFKAH
jgi:hypothetical protein